MGAQVRILPVATICFIRPFYPASGGKLSSPSSFTRGSLAEWSKALVLGTSPKGRGFESHSCQIILVQGTFMTKKSNRLLLLLRESLFSSVVEHWSRKPGVVSSNLTGGIFLSNYSHPLFRFCLFSSNKEVRLAEWSKA